MSDTQHTQGPWTFNESIPRMVSSKEGYITRDICRMDASTMQAFNQDANARLIAAAPELLEALKDARSVVSSINAGNQHALTVNDEQVFWQRDEWVRWALDEVLPTIEAAIAKATGEKP